MEKVQGKGKVTIIGSGMIGKSWGILFLRSGYSVCLYDTEALQLQQAVSHISTELHGSSSKDGDVGITSLLEKLTTTKDLKEAMQDAIYVQECVPENIDLKKKVFSTLDQLASDHVILASSTSCIPATTFTSNLTHKSQCIVAHPVNPPLYVPLVEVIPSTHTSPEVVERTVDMMRQLGKAPIVEKKELNGFVLNRLQYAIIMEAWRLVEDGVVSPQDVDTAVTEGLGLRYCFMGPMETMHLNANGIRDYCEKYGGNIKTVVCDEYSTARDLSGKTMSDLADHFDKQIPLNKLDERRKWREQYLKELSKFKQQMGKQRYNKLD